MKELLTAVLPVLVPIRVELDLRLFGRKSREQKETALAVARLAAIVESSGDAIVSKTLTGTVLTWNSAAERIFGYTSAEMVGSPIFRLIPPELHQKERELLARISRGERVDHLETILIRKDGTRLPIDLSVSPVRDHSGTVVAVSSFKRDISEQKRVEASLRQASKMEAIGALAGGLAHDFNNQLHALSGFAHFIARDPALAPGSRQDLIEIQKTIERMASLTRQLLAFARQQVLSPEILDLNTAVDDARPMLQRLIGSNMEIQLELTQGPKWVEVDRAQLVQILLNLVINARDAMPAGGRLVLRTETLEVSPQHVFDRVGDPVVPGAYAELTVSDAGEGIAPEHLPHIFEPFYTTKEVGQGTGLGLATVEGIVSQSGGRIQVESMMGEGTTIRILLPLTTEPEPRQPEGSSDAAPARRRARILVVDDENAVRIVVSRTLQAEGYDLLGARHGKEALYYLEQVGGSIDLVIADLVMPVMGGHDLTVELARRYPKIPVIWMSGHPREFDTASMGAEPTNVFLQKPVMPPVLLRTVEQVLQRQVSRA